ncbi:MAG: hypothetical protein ACFCVE_16050 [Phycisphaerae bacterium]
MKSLLKILFAIALLAVLVVGGLGFYIYRQTGDVPTWRRFQEFSADERQRLAQGVDSTLTRLTYMASNRLGTEAGADDAEAIEPVQIELSESQINAFFQKWLAFGENRQTFERYLREPYISLMDGHVVLSGKPPGQERVVSLHVAAEVSDEGPLTLELEKVTVGRMPIPQSFYDEERRQLIGKLESAIPGLTDRANVDADGVANYQAVAALMARDLVAILEGERVETVLFTTLGATDNFVPTRIQQLELTDESVTALVDVMKRERRNTYLRDAFGGRLPS